MYNFNLFRILGPVLSWVIILMQVQCSGEVDIRPALLPQFWISDWYKQFWFVRFNNWELKLQNKGYKY